MPPIPGVDGPNVIGAEALFLSPEKAGKRIVMLGGGLVGIELAIFMTGLGHKVTIMEMADSLNCGKNIVHKKAIDFELPKFDIELALGTKCIEIGENEVIGERNGERVVYPADTVVTALGRKALDAVCDELRFVAPEFYQIGDCLTPQTIYEATWLGHNTALDLGMA